RSVLLGVQVAVSIVLLVSAGLLVRGAQRAGAFDPGFAVNDVTAVSFELPLGAYDDARKRAFFDNLTDALRGLPVGAIDAFGFASSEPDFLRRGYQTSIRFPNQTAAQARMVTHVDISSDY